MEWPEIPPCDRQAVRFVDSHLHLDSTDSPLAVANARAAGVALLACGVDRETSQGVLKFAVSNPGTVEAFVGIHPSEAERERDLSWVSEALEQARGAGEIGLDPSYSSTGKGSAQLAAFSAQLEAAERRMAPVQVHSRGAEAQVLDVLGSFRTGPVLMHWLGREEVLQAVLQKGYYVSFSPALIYSKSLQRLALKCDRALTLLESDSPVPYGPLGGVHGPALVPSVAFRLAELWGAHPLEVLAETARNAHRFLGGDSKG
jgi:TatD DNase family protein